VISSNQAIPIAAFAKPIGRFGTRAVDLVAITISHNPSLLG